MKNRFLFLLALALIINSFSIAQNKIELTTASEENTIKSTYPLHAREYIERFNKAVGFDPKNIDYNEVSLQKTAWDFQVGTSKTWKASNFTTNQFYNVSSTCRAVGDNCYIFVEDAVWGSTVTQNGVNSVLNAFDNQTPADQNKGIYGTVTEVFGNPPNRDNDPKIIILILDIVDGFNQETGGGYVAGYFHSVNQSLSDPNSNKAEIFYIDGVQSNLTLTGGLNTAMSTVAHEFQHMIRFAQFDMSGISEQTFFDECLSLSSEIICGYSLFNQSRYADESNYFLSDWRTVSDPNVLNDYSRAARLGLYMLEQFGTQFFKKYRENKIPDMGGFNAALASIGSTRRMADILPDWFVANYLNNKNVNSRYGYDYQTPTQMKAQEHSNPNISRTSNVYNFASQYIAFTGGNNLNISFNTSDSRVKARAIKYSAGNTIVEDVQTNNTNYSVPEFGTTFNKVVFVVYFSDTNIPTIQDPKRGPYSFSYTASGTAPSGVQELAYDSTEPVGYINLVAGDSMAVYFNAVSGFRLDSIRVAIRNLAPINGRVLEYLGFTTKLGGKTYANITATSKLTVSPTANGELEYPYPKPYPNWTTIDLRTFNISADKSFVVEFPYEDPVPEKNRILVTYAPSSGNERTPIYKASTQTWGYSSVQGKPDYSWIGLIRAYVSSGTTDNKEVIELLPSAFALEQNYPNPFNPSTIISYQIPVQSKVQIKIFDALGREVRSLIDEEKSAGKYNIAWDGADSYGKQVASGVYFYSIISKEFVQTKKMVLMR